MSLLNTFDGISCDGSEDTSPANRPRPKANQFYYTIHLPATIPTGRYEVIGPSGNIIATYDKGTVAASFQVSNEIQERISTTHTLRYKSNDGSSASFTLGTFSVSGSILLEPGNDYYDIYTSTIYSSWQSGKLCIKYGTPSDSVQASIYLDNSNGYSLVASQSLEKAGQLSNFLLNTSSINPGNYVAFLNVNKNGILSERSLIKFSISSDRFTQAIGFESSTTSNKCMAIGGLNLNGTRAYQFNIPGVGEGKIYYRNANTSGAWQSKPFASGADITLPAQDLDFLINANGTWYSASTAQAQKS
ncbi:hypothetical protein, partial [Chitinivorax tropicus]|uniref:hypothetical protein n=1 Tax=Chitinivorax tropicus TaxID=714531 RepID=UPI001C8412C9